MAQLELKDHPVGTRIQIGDRFFERLHYGTFWKEIHSIPGNCCSRPSASLRQIELALKTTHIVLPDTAKPVTPN
ncbi:hypothetical protein RBE51_20830 [Pseudomonas taiwanensis]|nr:hypothetical protein [Pseudomonas taiwanensis]